MNLFRSLSSALGFSLFVALLWAPGACDPPATPTGAHAESAPEADRPGSVPRPRDAVSPRVEPRRENARDRRRPIDAGPVHDADAVRATTREPVRSSGGRPDVFLVVIDTLRVDAVGAYVDEERDTPFLDELAAEGVVFENAYATSSWTIPSMYSLITGLYPREHLVEMGGTSDRGVVGQPALSPLAETLPERLSAAGYTTFGVCTNYHLHPKYGFAQGFDYFVGNDFLDLPFPEIAVDALAELVADRSPAFVWLHYFDPHSPYVANAPWFDARNDSGFRDWNALSVDAISRLYRKVRGLPADARPVPGDLVLLNNRARALTFAHPRELLRAARLGGDDLVRRYVRFLRAAYSSEVAAVDRSLRGAFEELGVGDEDLVIVVADHGEEFLEHGGIGHRSLRSLHEELVHVPLVVLLPGRRIAGVKVAAPVSLVDLLPTVLEVAGLDPAAGGHSGRSLLPLVESRRGEAARPLYGELRETSGELRYRIDYPWKYIRDFARDREHLYNLAQDPAEQHNLARTQPQRVERMRTGLREWMDRTGPRWPEADPVPLSPVEIERLRAMGYLL